MSKPDASGESVLEEILDELFAAALKQESGEGEENNSSDVEKRVLENPNKISIDQLHLERSWLEKVKEVPDIGEESPPPKPHEHYQLRTEIIPALDVRWLTEKELRLYHSYQPYYPQFSKEENYLFKKQNILFCQTLEDLLGCDYQTFWCILLFAPEAGATLKRFICDPVYNFDHDSLDGEEMDMYAQTLIYALHVYQRMVRFRESETEYMAPEVGMNFLMTRKHLTTPVIMKLAMLLQPVDESFVRKVVGLYYVPRLKDVYTKEIRETLLFIKKLLEAIEDVCDSDASGPQLAEVELRRKPANFDPHWAQEIAAHLVESFHSLSSFLPLLDDAVEIAIELYIPKLIPMVYKSVYEELESYMADRASVPDRLRHNIHYYMKVGRNEAVKSFDAMVSYCIRKIMNLANKDKEQEGLVDMYLQWMQEALEYDIFINDYNSLSNVALQIDQISSFYPNIERLRVMYVKSSIETIVEKLNNPDAPRLKMQKLKNRKLSDFWNDIWKDIVEEAPPELDPARLQEEERKLAAGSTEQGNAAKFSESEIEGKIRTIMDTLPHLGDGFILQCLEHYHYDVTDTLAAILDQNLPPHLAEIPFDTIRIPEETKPDSQHPLIGHRGKREDYKDAMQMLNDKSAIKDIKDLIVINSTVKEDPYDDEFDDRFLEDEPSPRDDADDEDRVLRHLPQGNLNRPVVSDPSEESSEEEEEAAPARRKDAFCEDPAVVRARREAQRKANGRGRGADVVGKPKGQGQEKQVQQNRDKKNVHKSSRANHNRKGGAQWKRSRGMMPS